MAESLLRLSDVHKKVGRFSLGPIELAIESESIVALVGKNSSGKSVIFKMIMGLFQVEQGEIQFMGQDPNSPDNQMKQRMGYVGDQYQSVGHVTVKELAEFISYWYPLWDSDYYRTLLERYEIDENICYDHGSSGFQKKVQLILTLSYHPQLLLLDEASSGMDLASQRKMMEDLLTFMEVEGRGILLTSHNLDEVKKMADRIYVIHQGRITHHFDKDQVSEQWGRIWVDTPWDEEVAAHPHFIDGSRSNPMHIVTNQMDQMEEELQQRGIHINQIQKMDLGEVLEYLYDKN